MTEWENRKPGIIRIVLCEGQENKYFGFVGCKRLCPTAQSCSCSVNAATNSMGRNGHSGLGSAVGRLGLWILVCQLGKK